MTSKPCDPDATPAPDVQQVHPNGYISLRDGKLYGRSTYWMRAESSYASLALHDGSFEYRVIWRNRRPYGDVAGIDVETFLLAAFVTFTFRDGATTFVATMGNTPLTVTVLRRFQQEGCPLSPKAQEFVRDSRAAVRLRSPPQPGQAPPGRRVAGAVLLASGLACAAHAGWLATEARRFLDGAVTVDGTVSRLAGTSGDAALDPAGTPGRDARATGGVALFRFPSPVDGKPIEVQSPSDARVPAYHVGMTVKLLVNPGDPQQVYDLSGPGPWLWPVFAGMVSLVLIAAGTVLAISRRGAAPAPAHGSAQRDGEPVGGVAPRAADDDQVPP